MFLSHKTLILFSILLLCIFINSKKSHANTKKHTVSQANNHYFRKSNQVCDCEEKRKIWYGPFRIVSDVTYLLYLDTRNNATTEYSTVVVNNQSTVDTQAWYFRRLLDGNFSLYNKGAQMYLTLTPDKTRFVVGPYTGSEYQKFYVRSFWNGYAINCQVDLGYYNYLTVSANATVKSQYYNGNPKTQFFQLLGTDVLTLT